MANITLTKYQQDVVDTFVAGKNAIVDAVAGAGKTTTITHVARSMPGKRIMCNTYNRFLKEEVREKTCDIDNIVIHNHHSIAVIYYDPAAHTDIVLEHVLEEGVDIEPPDVDIVMYDESQDINLLYYKLARDFVRQLRKPVQLGFWGDRNQPLYQFKGADERYLTLAHKLWPGYDFVFLDLPESRRVPDTVAAFLNTNLLGYSRILSTKTGPKVEFMVGNAYNGAAIYKIIKDYKNDVDPGEIFVLTPSVRNDKSPFKRLANYFTSKNIPIYVSSNDESEVRDNVSTNKVVFTSFHQSKGREREIVVVYGMDKGYFQMFARDILPRDYNRCPSTFYVACTRAKKLLIVVCSAKDGPIEFLNMPTNDWYVNVTGRYVTTPKAVGPPKHNKISPTLLVKFIKPQHMLLLDAMVSDMFKIITPAEDSIEIQSLVEGATRDTFEDVSEINGLSIPAIWEQKHYNRCTILHSVIKNTTKYDTYLQQFARRVEMSYTPDNMSLAACVYISNADSLMYRPAQIPNYNWLSQYEVDLCHTHLNSNIGQDALFEQVVERKYTAPVLGIIPVEGRMDIVDRDNVWEIKCTSELRIEHKLQLAVYAWMCNGINKQFRILNIRTGEVYKLVADVEQLDTMMDILMDSKYGVVHPVDDDTFVQNALQAVRNRPSTPRVSKAKKVAGVINRIKLADF